MTINSKTPQIFFLSFILALVLSFISYGISKAAVFSPQDKCQTYPVQNLKLPSSYDTNIPYEQALKMNKLVAVEFYADWCGHCRAFAPVLHDIEEGYGSKYTFVTLNADKPGTQKLMDEFGVKSFPSLYLVNPKTGQRKFVDQNIYLNPTALKQTLDTFYVENK